MHGVAHAGVGRICSLELGLGTFVREDGGYTSVSVAVSLLVCLSLVMSLATVSWTQNRAADVQAVADSGALAGANVVAAYATVATVLDACVLTMGLAGMVTMGAGLVVSAVPGLSAAGATTVRAATKLLDARKRFATSAARGLCALEGTLPLAIAARSAAVVEANAQGEVGYVGVAVPFPRASETDFSGLEAEVGTDELVDVSGQIQNASDEVKRAKDEADAARLEGWLADCGADPSMRERAGSLAGLAGAENPHYPSVEGWNFGVPLRRARSYYARRIAIERPDGSGIEAVTDSIARSVFYDYAYERVCAGSYREYPDGSVDIDLPELPANTSQMRATRLYTDAIWPCTEEDGVPTLHSTLSCPGAEGPSSGNASLADVDAGAVAECDVCRMSAADLGKVASASTSIPNGFEHHWRKVVEASRRYERARDRQAQAERALKEMAERGSSAFDRAMEALAVPRPKLCPPGAWGCVAVVLRREGAVSPAELSAAFAKGARLPAGAAVSAATLAPDDDADGNDVLSRLFEAVAEDVGGGSAGVLGTIGELWGQLLAAYGSAAEGLSSAAEQALGGIEGVEGGGVADWLRGAISDVIRTAGLEPTDLRLRKPVLTNSQNVLDQAGLEGVGTARELVGRLPDTTDPVALARALGQQVVNELGGGSFTVAELPVPGTDLTIPLTLDVGEFLGGGAA